MDNAKMKREIKEDTLTQLISLYLPLSHHLPLIGYYITIMSTHEYIYTFRDSALSHTVYFTDMKQIVMPYHKAP